MFAMKPPAEVTDSSAWARQRLTRVVDAFRRGDIDSERKLICALTDQWKHLDRTGALNELVIDSAADTDFASLIGLGAMPDADDGSLESTLILAASRAIDRASGVRLERPLLDNTRLHRPLLDFAALVQIARHEVECDLAVRSRWASFWAAQGLYESLGRLTTRDAVRGYAVAVATYAIAPQWLRQRAPKTFERVISSYDFGEAFIAESAGPAIEVAISLAELTARARAHL